MYSAKMVLEGPSRDVPTSRLSQIARAGWQDSVTARVAAVEGPPSRLGIDVFFDILVCEPSSACSIVSGMGSVFARYYDNILLRVKCRAGSHVSSSVS